MAIPVIYNFRSVRARWVSSIVAVLGIAGTVGVFVAMLSLANGFRATLVASGSDDNAILMRAGATAEMMSGITLESIKIVQDDPGVARDSSGPLITSEVVVVAPFPLRATGTNANVQVRGVSANVLTIRRNVRIVEGRMFQPGLSELVVGTNANKTYSGLTLGNTVDFGGGHWRVVGIFDAGGSAFDSEVWADARVLDDVYKRPTNIYQSATVHLTSPAALQQLKDSVSADPRLNLDVFREVDYYAKQSTAMTRLITVLGGLVAFVMAIGAVFGALNTMYSAVSERGREIATMRARLWRAGCGVLIPDRGLADRLHRRRAGMLGGAAPQRPHYQHHQLADVFESGIRFPYYARPSAQWHVLRAGDGPDRRPASGRQCSPQAHSGRAARTVTVA